MFDDIKRIKNMLNERIRTYQQTRPRGEWTYSVFRWQSINRMEKICYTIPNNKDIDCCFCGMIEKNIWNMLWLWTIESWKATLKYNYLFVGYFGQRYQSISISKKQFWNKRKIEQWTNWQKERRKLSPWFPLTWSTLLTFV